MASVEPRALQLGPCSNGMLLSPWEFDAADAEPGWRYELVNGVLIVNPSPSLGERDPNEELGRWLRAYQENHEDGAALDFTIAEQTIHIGPHRRRVDRAIWAGLGRLPTQNETPTTAVEFISDGKRNQQRDYDVKRSEYETAGVLEYWVLNRFGHTMTVYRFARGRMSQQTLTRRPTYTTKLLPGFKLPLAQLFKFADRWSNRCGDK